MMLKSRLLTALDRIFSILFAIAMVASVFLIHRMFKISMESEAMSLARDIEYSVMHAATNEYRRYTLLVQSLRNLDLEDQSDITLRSQLERIFELYNDSGIDPYLLAAISYSHDNRDGLTTYFDSETETWIERQHDSGPPNQDWHLLFVYKPNRDEELSIFIDVDIRLFMDNYVKDAVESQLPDYKLEWVSADDSRGEKAPDRNKDFKSSRFTFHPFRALLGIETSGDALFVPIPGIHDSINLSGDPASRPEPQEMDEKFIFFPIGFGPVSENGLFRESDWQYAIKIRSEHGSFYADLEKRAAINFFASLILLLGVTAAFFLARHQARRLKGMREREREFVASITHELRTPLTVIQAAADNLSNGIIPAERLSKYSEIIQQQSLRLGGMINEILMFSNLEAGGSKKPVGTEIDLETIFEGLMKELDTITSAGKINLIWDVSALKGSCVIVEETLTLVLRNLVMNTINHAYDGNGGDVRVSGRVRIPDGLVFTVEDDGRGIESREQRHVFDPFYRDYVSRSRQEKGSGLGLFLARRKAVLAGGSLKLESPYRRINGRKQHGCRFEFTIPCKYNLK